MRTHTLVLASIVAASIFSNSPASALEARETRSHLTLDVPATWVVEHQGEWVRAHPAGRVVQFQVSVAGTESPASTDTEANSFLWTQAATGGGRSLSQMRATTATHKIEWGNFVGYEVSGTGKTANGYDTDLAPAKWFGVLLVSKADPKKAVYAVGWGTPAVFDQNQPGIYTALRALRPYTE